MVYRVEYVRTDLESKPSFPYENGEPNAFWIEGTVGKFIEGIKPLPKVVSAWIVIVLTSEGGGGGIMPPPTTVMMGV
jgi:hypothetical protein